MATLRSGKKLDSNANTEEDFEDKKKVPVKKDRTTLVVFFGLLIDLLGKIEKPLSRGKNVEPPDMFAAFTLILPLFPALISHYRENDSSGLFRFLETKVGGLAS